MLKPLPWHILQISEAASPAALFVDVRIQKLTGNVPDAVAAQAAEIDAMHNGIRLRMCDNRGNESKPTIRRPNAVLVQYAKSAESPAVLEVRLIVDVKRTFVLYSGKYAVTK